MSKPYVYVVDDDEVIRLNIAKKLSRLNCDVRAFDSGEALLECLRNQRDEPDVMLLDYRMRGINGVETLQAVRKIAPIPAVIFTAYAGLVDLQAVKALGRCEVMLKTIDLNILGQIVNSAMAVNKLRNTDWADRDSCLG